MNTIIDPKKAPVFSIVIPTYNRPATFRRAVASTASQSFRDFEVIVVDDGSATQYATETCSEFDLDCTVIINDRNRGVAASRNAGIAAARGDYIAFLDDDDEYLESFLQSTYEQLHPSDVSIGFSWCGANIYHYNADGTMQNTRLTKTFVSEGNTNESLFDQLFSIGSGYGLTVKTACIRKTGAFDERYRVVEDTDFFLRLLTAGFYPRIVPGIHIALHNQHQVRLTSSAMHELRIREGKVILEKYQDFFTLYPSIYKKCNDHLLLLERELKQELAKASA